MTRATTWTNSDGLVVGFGRNIAERQATAMVETDGSIKEVVMDFTYQSTSPALELPADCVVTGMYLIQTELWDGGTSLKIGDGNDDDGWFTATLLAEATLDDENNQIFVADGAYAIGDAATNRGLQKKYSASDTIDVTITGTFTSGKSRLVVNYVSV
jgi:hypothetical protein